MLAVLIAASAPLCRYFYFQSTFSCFERVSLCFPISLQQLLPSRFKPIPFHSRSDCRHVSCLQINMFGKGEGGKNKVLTSLSAWDLSK